MSTHIRIPRRFYDDHAWRDLPTPPAVRATQRYVWIDRDHEAVPELLSDAHYYASEARHMGAEFFGLWRSATATVRAIEAAGRTPARNAEHQPHASHKLDGPRCSDCGAVAGPALRAPCPMSTEDAVERARRGS